MSIKFDGKINFLSGHYQDIIITENKEENYRIRITPNNIYSVKELDKLYNHEKYNGLTDIEKLERIIDSYLYHNTIFMITNYGRLKYHSGYYQALNAYYTFIDGYKSLSRSMYFQLRSRKIDSIEKKVVKKYAEDRIKHLSKMLKSRKVKICLSCNSSCYIINDDDIYIELFSKNDNEFNLQPLEFEIKFLKTLLTEFIKKNGAKVAYDRDEKVILHDKKYNTIIELEHCLTQYILQSQLEIYNAKKQHFHNITIDEYLSSLKKN